MKKPIYLTGPMRNFSSSQQDEFEKAKVALEKLHHVSVISSIDEYEKLNFEIHDTAKDDIMRLRISNMLQCGMLVHLHDFEYDIEASFEFRLAKFLNMKIIGINFALKPESTNGNSNDNQFNTEPTHASDQQK